MKLVAYLLVVHTHNFVKTTTLPESGDTDEIHKLEGETIPKEDDVMDVTLAS